VGVDGDKSRGRSLMRIACCHVVGNRVLPWFPAVPEENTAARRKRHGMGDLHISQRERDHQKIMEHHVINSLDLPLQSHQIAYSR
jgi:hypothetical protein